MAAPQVHDKSGKCCHLCGKVFDKKSFNVTTTRIEGAFWVKYTVCGECKLKEMRPDNETRD